MPQTEPHLSPTSSPAQLTTPGLSVAQAKIADIAFLLSCSVAHQQALLVLLSKRTPSLTLPCHAAPPTPAVSPPHGSCPQLIPHIVTRTSGPT